MNEGNNKKKNMCTIQEEKKTENNNKSAKKPAETSYPQIKFVYLSLAYFSVSLPALFLPAARMVTVTIYWKFTNDSTRISEYFRDVTHTKLLYTRVC